MNWYQQEREMKYREQQARVAGERSIMLRELQAMKAEQRRKQRAKVLAFVSAKWHTLRGRAAESDRVDASMTPATSGASSQGG